MGGRTARVALSLTVPFALSNTVAPTCTREARPSATSHHTGNALRNQFATQRWLQARLLHMGHSSQARHSPVVTSQLSHLRWPSQHSSQYATWHEHAACVRARTPSQGNLPCPESPCRRELQLSPGCCFAKAKPNATHHIKGHSCTVFKQLFAHPAMLRRGVAGPYVHLTLQLS